MRTCREAHLLVVDPDSINLNESTLHIPLLLFSFSCDSIISDFRKRDLMYLCWQFPRFFLHVDAQTDQEILRVPSKLLFVVTALRCESDQRQPLRYRVLGFGEGRTFPVGGEYMMNKQL